MSSPNPFPDFVMKRMLEILSRLGVNWLETVGWDRLSWAYDACGVDGVLGAVAASRYREGYHPVSREGLYNLHVTQSFRFVAEEPGGRMTFSLHRSGHAAEGNILEKKKGSVVPILHICEDSVRPLVSLERITARDIKRACALQNAFQRTRINGGERHFPTEEEIIEQITKAWVSSVSASDLTVRDWHNQRKQEAANWAAALAESAAASSEAATEEI